MTEKLSDDSVVTLLQQNIQQTLRTVGDAHLFNVKTKYSPAKFFNKLLEEAGITPWNCSCCNKFLNRYGRIVTVDEKTGELTSVVWSKVIEHMPENIKVIMAKMNDLIVLGKITSMYVNVDDSKTTLGFKTKGGFNHLHLDNAEQAMFHNLHLKKAVDVNRSRLTTMLADWRLRVDKMNELVVHLKNSSNNRCQNFAKGLAVQAGYIQAINNVGDNNLVANLLWAQAANFGQHGRAGVKGTVVGEALDSFINNGATAALKTVAAFANEINYQRPTTEMKAINDLTYNRTVEAIAVLGYTDSIARRTVKSEEVEDKAIWVKPIEPTKEEVKTDIFKQARGVETEESASVVLAGVKSVTFDTFLAKVLPTAKLLYVDATHENRGLNWGTIMGAANEDCKPIVKWATEENPTQYSWAMNPELVPTKGLLFHKEKLEITRLFNLPCQWDGASFKGMEGFMFHVPEWNNYLLEHKHATQVGNSLFPEIIKPELYEHRKVIEAINNETVIPVVESNLFFTGLDNFAQMPHLIVDNGETVTHYALFKEQL